MFKTESSTLMQHLKRFPLYSFDPLQAWDAADELTLQHIENLELKGKRILILNDQFGALACGLESLAPTVYTDSYTSFKALEFNSQGRIKPLRLLNELSGVFDTIIIRIPKNMSFFEDILCHLSQHLAPKAQVICASMVKYLAKTSFQLLDRFIGSTTTSLAHKKARLVFARFERSPVPSRYPIKVPIDSFPIAFVSHSNLFSHDKLDIGTRFLLDHIPRGSFKNILDLGCGNGIIGIAAGIAHPFAKLHYSDESAMAIESAKVNHSAFFPERAAEFQWTYCYENQKPDSIDLVLCNPPFHQSGPTNNIIARDMFINAHRSLVSGGTLRVIGNTFLGYPQILKQIFGNSTKVASNSKFTIVDSKK